MNYAGIIFDFDGVLLESEHVENAKLAEYLTRLGHPTSAADSMANFMGLSGTHFTDAIEQWIGRPLPQDFAESRAVEKEESLARIEAQAASTNSNQH